LNCCSGRTMIRLKQFATPLLVVLVTAYFVVANFIPPRKRKKEIVK
jgi:hypothetical protein